VRVDTHKESECAASHLEHLILLPRDTIEFKIKALLELADKSKVIFTNDGTLEDAALAVQTLNIRLVE